MLFKMSFEDLLEFQTPKLNYTFKNIELLKDALTHSTDFRDYNTGNKFRRLKALGNAVLKLVTSEYVIQSSGLVDEGILSKRRDILIKVSTSQATVAKSLFDTKSKIVKISEGTRKNPTFRVVSIYHEFPKAVFGAVFLDAGGSSGVGIEKCMNLFRRLWECFGTNKSVPDLDTCFPVHRKIREYWIKMGMNHNYLKMVEACFGVEFENSDLLCEALIQATFYDSMGNNGKELYKPNFQRLEFLGDAVLELIITEFMFHKHRNEDASVIVERTNQEKSSKRLKEVAEQLKFGAGGLVRVQRYVAFGNFDDVLEAVIGAIYVDSGHDISRQFILREWGFVPCKKTVVKVKFLEGLLKGGQFGKVDVECRPKSSFRGNMEVSLGDFLEESRRPIDDIFNRWRKNKHGIFSGLRFDPIRKFWWWIKRPVESFFELAFNLVVLLVVVKTVIYFAEPHWNKLNDRK